MKWHQIFDSEILIKIERKLKRMSKEVEIYPKFEDRYKAFKLTDYDNVKVVILGQDPYHGPNQANGLAFSVNKDFRIPPSLRNIYKEIENDLGINMSNNGELDIWAKQGILLFNTALTVERGKPESHCDIWKPFTIDIIKKLLKKEPIFLLWGKKAQHFFQEALSGEDELNFKALYAAHPSPFSVNRGFFNCRHFSKVNKILEEEGKETINWQI